MADYCDQHGAGKRFDSGLDPGSLNIDRMKVYLGEVVDLLLKELEQERVFMVAHSWGTPLRSEYVASRPETVATHFTIGQIVDWLESDGEGYEWALTAARTAGDAEVLAELEAIGPPPYSIDQLCRAQPATRTADGCRSRRCAARAAHSNEIENAT